MKKYIHEFKAGDLVQAHGGLFKITTSAYASQSHLPRIEHLKTGHGPSDCAIAQAVCIEGECGGYFSPGTDWTFQGNFLAGKYQVIAA
jgi:hypothetical protein